jgi:hypothetical protein
VPTALFEAKSVEYNQIFVAPLLMRHIMPLLMQEDEIVVSIPERDGAGHDYTFSMQPNDLALRPIRSCFDFLTDDKGDQNGFPSERALDEVPRRQ